MIRRSTLLLAALLATIALAQDRRALDSPRLETISRRYLGVRYQLDPLGEERGPDRDPLFTRACVDCQTLVEQVLAEALAGDDPQAIRGWMRRLRHRGGDPRLETRFHYPVPDWLEHPWPARDVTVSVGGEGTAQVTRTHALGALITGRGGDPAPAGPATRRVTASYIPWARLAQVQSRVPDGAIGCFVARREDLVVGHVGFLFQRSGTLVLRHGSTTQHAVVDQPLDDWLAAGGRRRFLGVIVLQPTLSGLDRDG